jgi:hypothetical protein
MIKLLDSKIKNRGPCRGEVAAWADYIVEVDVA